MTSIDAFYEAVAEQIRGEIQRAPEPDAKREALDRDPDRQQD